MAASLINTLDWECIGCLSGVSGRMGVCMKSGIRPKTSVTIHELYGDVLVQNLDKRMIGPGQWSHAGHDITKCHHMLTNVAAHD